MGPVNLYQMGLLNRPDWKAQWISAPTPRKVAVDTLNLPPSPYLRRNFSIAKPIKQALSMSPRAGFMSCT